MLIRGFGLNNPLIMFKIYVKTDGVSVLFQTLEDLTSATQLALALHQSSSKDVSVLVFCSSEDSKPFVNLFK